MDRRLEASAQNRRSAQGQSVNPPVSESERQRNFGPQRLPPACQAASQAPRTFLPRPCGKGLHLKNEENEKRKKERKKGKKKKEKQEIHVSEVFFDSGCSRGACLDDGVALETRTLLGLGRRERRLPVEPSMLGKHRSKCETTSIWENINTVCAPVCR